MDPKMLQALGLSGAAGLDPKLLGMSGMSGMPGLDPKTLGLAGADPKMMAALGMAGLDPKTNQAMANQTLQLQQQLAIMGMAGMDPKSLQSALGLGNLDAQTLAALTGTMPGMDLKAQLQLQQQQDMQAKALAQMMGGAMDPKLLGLAGMTGVPGVGLSAAEDMVRKAAAAAEQAKRKEKKSRTPTPPKPAASPQATDQTETKPEETVEDKTESPVIENGVSENGETKNEDKEGKEPEVNGEKSETDTGNAKPEEGENKENEEIETIPNGEENDEKKKSLSTPTPTLPVPSSVPSSLGADLSSAIPGIDAATMKALGSLGSMDPKTMKANGLDPALLKSLGLGGPGGPAPGTPTSKSPSSIPGLPSGMPRMPGMEGLDNETLKLLATGDPAAMQKLMANPTSAMMAGLDPRMMGLDAQAMAALMGGQDQSKLLLASSQASQEKALLKQMGLDAHTVQALQQQQLQQQQLAQMGLLSGMGLGGMDPKMLQMMGMPQMDQKYLQGLQGIESSILQQSMGYLGNMPGGLDAATMQQILGGAGAKGGASKKGSTPRKGSAQQSLQPQTSIPNLDILRQQEQLLLQMTGQAAGMKPDLNAQELQALLAQQMMRY
jgi:hypothetical protein